MTHPLADVFQLERLTNPRRMTTGPYQTQAMPVTGIVVSADDPLEMGRVRVYCQALHDDPRNPESVPWAMYCSPFFGTINDSSMRRGPEGDTSDGAVSYGMWAIPEVGAEVLITTVNGDPNSRVWLGCIPNQQQVNTWGHGRYVWDDGAYADGPYTGGTPAMVGSAGDATPIEPLYSNLDAAFASKKTSPEWLTRGADLQGLSNPSASQYTGSRDQRFGEIQDIMRRARGPGAQLLKHYANTITSAGYGWSGIRSGLSKTSKVSRVYGISTPGLHSFTMDDRHGNSRIRLRSGGGSQVLLDDTNERVYVSTGRGNSWFEMDWNGNIDTYAGRRYSVHALNDINFTSHGTIRLQGRRGVHIVAGTEALEEAEQNLSSLIPDGQVRIHSQDDLHLFSDNALRAYSQRDTLFHAAGSMHYKTDDAYHLWSKNDTNVFASTGSIVATAGKSISGTATLNVSFFAGASASLTAVTSTSISALTGALSLGGGGGLVMKGMGGSIDLQAVDGAINLKTGTNNFSLDKTGIRAATTGQVLMQGENIEARSAPTTPPSTSMTDTPPSEDCSEGGPFAYTSETSSKEWNGTTYTWPSGVSNMARACYNAGFRGSDLVQMVAVLGQESQFGKNVRGPATTDSGKSTQNDPKWYPHCLGPFQMRCLRDPSKYGGLDAQRRPDVAFNLDESAKWAYQLQRSKGWNQWSGYTDGKYRQYMSIAQEAVNKLCGTSGSNTSVVQPGQAMAGAAPGTVVGTAGGSPIVMPGSTGTAPSLSAPTLPEPVLDVSALSDTVSVMKITGDSIRMQGVNDVFFKTAIDGVGTSMMCMRSKLDDIVGTFNASMTDTLGFLRDSTDKYRNMILSMATSLQTGLAQAANSVTPTNAIAAMVQVINDINDVIELITMIQNGIDSFLDYPALVMRGIEEMFEIPMLDMNLSAFIPAQLATLPLEIERTFTDLRNTGLAMPSVGGGPIGGGLLDIADTLGVDTSRSPPTLPTSCP